MSLNFLSKLFIGLILTGCGANIKQIEESNTVNTEIQTIVQKELEDAVAVYQATAATGIVMDSKTGKIISMVSIGNADPMKNTYEMGSHFKVFNTVLAYENGLTDKEYRVNQSYLLYDKYGKQQLKVADISSFANYLKQKNITEMTADDIFIHSCNVGSAKIAFDLPNDAQAEMFHRLKLDKTLTLDFGTTERALTPEFWGPTEKATAAFGHGISVTPMHMIASLNAVVTGEYVLPRFNDATKIQTEHVVSEDISKHIRDVLHKKAEFIGSKKDNIGISSATAEKNDIKTASITSMFVTFPIEKPQYSMFILIDNPQVTNNSFGLKTAAWNVIPTTGKIIEQIKPMLIK